MSFRTPSRNPVVMWVVARECRDTSLPGSWGCPPARLNLDTINLTVEARILKL